MYRTAQPAAISAIFFALFRAFASLSITQGPAIRNSGVPPPRRSGPREISRVKGSGGIASIEDNIRRRKSGVEPPNSKVKRWRVVLRRQLVPAGVLLPDESGLFCARSTRR